MRVLNIQKRCNQSDPKTASSPMLDSTTPFYSIRNFCSVKFCKTTSILLFTVELNMHTLKDLALSLSYRLACSLDTAHLDTYPSKHENKIILVHLFQFKKFGYPNYKSVADYCLNL